MHILHTLGVVERGFILIFIPLLILSTNVIHKFKCTNKEWGSIVVYHLDKDTQPKQAHIRTTPPFLQTPKMEYNIYNLCLLVATVPCPTSSCTWWLCQVLAWVHTMTGGDGWSTYPCAARHILSQWHSCTSSWILLQDIRQWTNCQTTPSNYSFSNMSKKEHTTVIQAIDGGSIGQQLASSWITRWLSAVWDINEVHSLLSEVSVCVQRNKWGHWLHICQSQSKCCHILQLMPSFAEHHQPHQAMVGCCAYSRGCE